MIQQLSEIQHKLANAEKRQTHKIQQRKVGCFRAYVENNSQLVDNKRKQSKHDQHSRLVENRYAKSDSMLIVDHHSKSKIAGDCETSATIDIHGDKLCTSTDTVDASLSACEDDILLSDKHNNENSKSSHLKNSRNKKKRRKTLIVGRSVKEGQHLIEDDVELTDKLKRILCEKVKFRHEALQVKDVDFKEDKRVKNKYKSNTTSKVTSNINYSRAVLANTNAKNQLRKSTNNIVSIPRPKRGMCVSTTQEPLRDIVVEAIGYIDEPRHSVAENLFNNDSDQNDQKISNKANDVEKQHARTTQKSTPRVNAVPAHHADGNIDTVQWKDPAYFLASLPYDTLPVQVFSYQQQSYDHKTEAAVRFPPIGIQQVLASTGHMQCLALSPRITHQLSTNAVSERNRWHQITSNVNDISVVSAMLTSVRLAPEWSLTTTLGRLPPHERAQQLLQGKKASVGNYSNINQQQSDYITLRNNERRTPIPAFLPPLTETDFYMSLTGNQYIDVDPYVAEKFDWPIPPARASTQIDDGEATVELNELADGGEERVRPVSSSTSSFSILPVVL
jgi:hypothetical protein